MDEGLGKTQSLLHAARESVDEVITFVGKVEQVENVFDHPLSLGTTNFISDGKEIEKLPDLHSIVDAKGIGHVPNASPHIHGVL